MKFKKTLAGITTFALAMTAVATPLGGLPFTFDGTLTASAGSMYNDSYDGFGYTVNKDEGTVNIEKYLGDDTSVVVPSKIYGKDVVAIKYQAFSNNADITDVTLPDTVTDIEGGSFNGCTSLKSINFPEGITSIGSSAFSGCSSLESVDFPKTLETIGSSAFMDCVLITSVDIPDSVTTIESSAFSGCSALKEVKLGKNIEKIDSYTFEKTAIEDIDLPDSLTYLGHFVFSNTPLYESQLNATVKYADNWVIGSTVNTITAEVKEGTVGIASRAFDSSEPAETILPDGIKYIYNLSGTNLRNIPDSVEHIVFTGVLNSSITVPDTVKYFYFEDCPNLTKVTLPSNATEIVRNCFRDCRALEEIVIPDSVEKIDTYAFDYCKSLKKITLGKSVKTIGSEAFRYCSSLTEIAIPDSVISIGRNAFVDSGVIVDQVSPAKYADNWLVAYVPEEGFSKSDITSLEIKDGTVGIADEVFANYGLRTVKLPDTLRCIGYRGFYYCPLTEVVLPDSITDIGVYAFYGCDNMEKLTLGKSLKVIGNYAFDDCKRIESITIPDGVTYIGDGAFCDCDTITTIEIPDSVTYLGESAFRGCDSLMSFKLGKNITELNSLVFANNPFTTITIPETVTKIGRDAFYNCVNLTELTIPDTVTYIDDYAFRSCYRLAGSLVIPDSVTYVGESAFAGTIITDLIIGKGVTEIRPSAFSRCEKLESVTLPETITRIGYEAFVGCTNLAKVNIPEAVTYIGMSAFSGCALEELTLPKDLTFIDENAFSGCKFRTLVIPPKMEEILPRTFENCDDLNTVRIPITVTTIHDYAFNRCSDLYNIYYGGSEEDWEKIVIGVYNSPLLSTYKLKFNQYEHVHDYKETTVTAATCTTDGLKRYTCVDGDDSYDEVIFATGHSESKPEEKNKVDATCTKDGSVDEIVYCLDCGKELSRTNVTIYAKGHKPVTDKAVAATCTTDGKTEGSHCSVCNTVIKAQTTVKATGHTSVSANNGKAATCTAAGKESDTKCSVCGVTLTTGKTIAAKGHSYGSWTTTKAATCTAAGTQTRSCSACGGKETKTIAATGHKSVSANNGKAATCTEAGKESDTKCSVCGITLTTGKTINAKGHTYTDKVVAPTTTAQGYTLHTCSVCGSSYKDNYKDKLTVKVSAVKGLKLKGRANNALRIAWNKNTSADGYIVEMYKGGKWVRVAKIAKIANNTPTEWKQTGLAAGTAYKFRVKAYKMDGKTAVYSSYATISARTNPSNVTGMKTLGRAKTAVRFGWKKNTSADGYIVEMYKNGKWVRAAKITKNSTVQFKKTGLKANTTYKFRVKAYKMSGPTALYSGYTNFKISTTK